MIRLFKHPVILILLLILCPTTILIFLLSNDPLLSLTSFFSGPFSNTYHLGNMLNSSSPLLLTSLGAYIALKSNSFNLGGEGQVFLGATITALLSVYFDRYANYGTLGLIILIAIIATGLITWLSAWLDSRYHVNSLISTYLLSMATIHICNYFITQKFLKEGSNILASDKINDLYKLKNILPPSTLSSGFVIALVIVVISSFILKYTILGYEFKISGRNTKFAHSMGINSNIYKISGLTLSGSLHGLAGVLLVLGNHHAVIVGFSNNLGWNGLSSALLAGSKSIMIIVTSLLYSYLDSGSNYATITSDLTIEVSTIVKSVLFFVISSKIIKEQIIYRNKK